MNANGKRDTSPGVLNLRRLYISDNDNNGRGQVPLSPKVWSVTPNINKLLVSLLIRHRNGSSSNKCCMH